MIERKKSETLQENAPEGDIKSSRSSVSLGTRVTKKGQLSESLSSGSCLGPMALRRH
jgi:hypothetical protein